MYSLLKKVNFLCDIITYCSYYHYFSSFEATENKNQFDYEIV